MSRIPTRAQPESPSPDHSDTPIHTPREGGQKYNLITTPLPSTTQYEDSDPAPVEIQPFQNFHVLDYASIPQQTLQAIPEEPFAYANLLERTGWDACSESRARDRFREMVRGAYDFHLRVRETTHQGALPRLMETVFDRQENLRYVRFMSPPGFSAIPESDNGQFRMFRGNPLFVAPEVAQGCVHAAHQVDIWVLGVVLYVMLVGRYPFAASNDRKLFKKMMKSTYTVPDYLSAEARDLIHRMLSPDPIMRASFDLVLIHPWLEPITPITLSPSTVGLTTTFKPFKPHGAIASIKNLFRRTPEFATLLPPTPPRTPSPQPTSPSPQPTSPSLSTTSLGSAEHTPANSTSTIETTSTRPTTASTSSIASTASTISTSIKSAFKWLLDGPNPPPPRLRKSTKRFSPYGSKPARRENVDADIGGFEGIGGERECDGDWSIGSPTTSSRKAS